MFTTDFYPKKSGSNALMQFFCFLIFTLFSVSVHSQGMACNDLVQVSLDADCEALITPGMILEGEDEDDLDAFSVSISGISGNVVTTPGEYSVTVTNSTTGNSCWGNISVEDKLAPSIEECACPPGNTDPGCQFLCTDLESILNNTLLTPQPVVVENCSGLISEYSDVVSSGSSCGEQIITRQWLFTDDAGNTSSGCVQEFTLAAVALGDIVQPVTPLEVPCGTDVSMAGLVAYWTPLVGSAIAQTYAFPSVNGVALTEPICNTVTSKTDLVIPICEISCSNSVKVLRQWVVLDWCTGEAAEFTQIIKSEDQVAPTVVAADITVSTDPWQCVGNFFLPAPSILHDDCTDFVEYTVTGPAGVSITYNTANDLWLVTGAPKGVHTFTYVATDCCGNIGTDDILVTILDQTAPVPVAKEFIVVTLTNGGTAKIFAPSVDNGSHDGCTAIHLEIRRDNDNCGVIGNTTYNNDGHPQDANNDPDDGQFVKFCCEDVNTLEVDVDGDGQLDQGYVKVWLRVWDDGDMDGVFGSANDNFNETWSFVKVDDKLPPALVCPPNVTIECDDDETDLTLTGTATASATCGGLEVDYSDIPNLNSCGIGTISRRWFVVSDPTVRCTQIITKDGDDLFNGNISWPQDYTTDCTDLDDNGSEPTWSAPPCSQVGYSIDSDTFTIEEDACLKIINYWTVVDWCQYDPNQSQTVGKWTHTQVIKVLDDEAPELMCTPQMYEVDENCVNENLMLTAVADDNGDCSSKWLKWTALVDIWGDGTYDYEYSSLLPVFDNNINNDTNGNGINDRYLAPTGSGEEVKITLPVDIESSMANHKISWKVSDGCGNVTSCNTTFMVVDKKKPTPYCISLSTALMENGMVELWACDFDLGAFDNCTEQGDLRFTFTDTPPQQDPTYDSQTRCSAMTFDCNDIEDGFGVAMVDVYVWDEKDNFDFCTVELTILDNQGGCGSTTGGSRIAGQVVNPLGSPVADMEVMLDVESSDFMRKVQTDNNGNYSFNNIPMGLDYDVLSVYDEEHRKGINTLDLVKIQRHILGVEQFNTAYQTIAADVNGDEKISAADLLTLRKLILGVSSELPNVDSYIAIARDQEYVDIFSPWPLTTQIDLDNLQSNMTGQDLVMLKMGDVDQTSYETLTTGDNGTESAVAVALQLETAVQPGKTTLRATHTANMAGMQMVIDLHGAVLSDVTSNLVSIDKNDYAVRDGKLYLSIVANGAIDMSAGDELLILHTDADVELSTTDILANEAYIGSALKVVAIQIAPEQTVTEVDAYVYALEQNEPNPFKDVTTLQYTLPTAEQVQVTVYDVNGKQVLNETVSGVKGSNSHPLDLSGAATGVYYYSIKAGDFTATKKMILVD